MAAISDIPHLIQLLDDESEEVRTHIWEVLQSFGEQLESTVAELWGELARNQQQQLSAYFENQRWDRFQAAWWKWLEIENDQEALTYALNHLMELDKPWGTLSLHEYLTIWRDELLEQSPNPTLHDVLTFLFVANGGRLLPASTDQQGEESCHLIQVMEHGYGQYLALSLVAVMIGRSIGLQMVPYLYRSNYLILGETSEGLNIFDPYRQGKSITPYQLESEKYPLRLSGLDLWSQQPSLTELVMRVLNQLIHAYVRSENLIKAQRYQSIKDQLVALLSKDQGF
ncbi:MAG: transglutaminase family protein [Bacteroidota bacterium]